VTATPDDDVAVTGVEPDRLPEAPMPPAVIPIDLLRPHPDNARADLGLTEEFIASIAEFGIRKPLQVAPDDDGGFLVIDGNRRLAGAIKAGKSAAPCYLDPAAADKASQFLDMVMGNGAGYRKNFTRLEEATALFAAHEAGASRTRIRKATGRTAAQVKSALAAGGLSAEARDAAGEMSAQLDLDQLAMLAEFDGDPDAVTRISRALRSGYGAEHEAERIRQERAEAAEHVRLIAELEAAGITITDGLPEGALVLQLLEHDGQELTAEAHAACPGRGAYFRTWNPLQPVHYCASPQQNGHAEPDHSPPIGEEAVAGAPVGAPVPANPAAAARDREPEPNRRLVIEGNKSWKAAAEVRTRFLAGQLFARRAAPPGAARFVARQLLTMAEPLRSGLASAPGMVTFAEITRQPAAVWLEIADTTATARLPLLMLAPIAAAYERALADSATWRIDRYSICPRREAGAYFAFLASVGYELSAIEQAVADGIAYTGEPPAGPALDISITDSTPDDDGSQNDISSDTPSDRDAPVPEDDAGNGVLRLDDESDPGQPTVSDAEAGGENRDGGQSPDPLAAA
jgi:ParB family chromosome partitioning protein